MKKDSAKFKAHLRRIAAIGGKTTGKSKKRGSKKYYSEIAKRRWAREGAKSRAGGKAGKGSVADISGTASA